MIRFFGSRQFLLFLMTGGVAALANFGSRFMFSDFLDFGTAIIAAYLVGMCTAFILAKLFVFKNTQHSTAKSFALFTAVNVLAIVQTYLISIGLAHYVFPSFNFVLYPEALAHAVGVVFPVFTSFIGHKNFSFRSKSC